MTTAALCARDRHARRWLSMGARLDSLRPGPWHAKVQRRNLLLVSTDDGQPLCAAGCWCCRCRSGRLGDTAAVRVRSVAYHSLLVPAGPLASVASGMCVEMVCGALWAPGTGGCFAFSFEFARARATSPGSALSTKGTCPDPTRLCTQDTTRHRFLGIAHSQVGTYQVRTTVVRCA